MPAPSPPDPPVVRSRALVALEALAVAALAALLLPVAGRVAGSATHGAALVPVGAAVAAGWLAADLVSGLVHWLCDRFFEEDTPGLGPLLIRPFREHHRDPAGMTRHGLLELTGNSALGLLPVVGAAAWARAGLFADAAAVAFALAALATNVFHAWAHAARVPSAVAWLQRRRVILSPATHAGHHAPGFRGAYCVTAGWLNGVLDTSGILDAAERALRTLGVPPARETMAHGRPAAGHP